jgi:hypothetical protein
MRVTVNPKVIFEEVEGESILLQLEGGIYYKLNGSGSRIWALLQEHDQIDDVHGALVDEYRVDPEVAKKETERLVSELEKSGLIVVERP